jgi:hypothetical protein
MDRITNALRGGDGEPGDGTQLSGYASPEYGPFECENCVHFEAPDKCNHPKVIADPEVNGNVQAEGCCNYFKSAHNETQDQEHSEGHEEE